VALSQNQFDALVSFIFNVGIGNFTKSTLAKKIIAKDKSAPQEILKWNKAGGVLSNGLVRRREAELKLFLS
jgi:GH24 family phage-related lysozyme (muramidase)